MNDNENELNNQLNAIKYRIDKSIERAKKLRIEKAQSGNLENVKIEKAHQNKIMYSIEEDKKAQSILEYLNATVEVSRVKNI